MLNGPTATQILTWYDTHRRDLPWRTVVSKNSPTHVYMTWVCEVMSQQTVLSVVQGKLALFMDRCPHVRALAQISDEELRILWAGLGYYARARNLRAGARYLLEHYGINRFPQNAQDWQNVPGCGPYTAAMVASICFDDPAPAMDGNIIRVCSRLLGLGDEVWQPQGQKKILEFLKKNISHTRPGDFNQGMMELGALVCRKTKPQCGSCPLQKQCVAFAKNMTDTCPPPKPRPTPKQEHVFCLVFLQKRAGVLQWFLIERVKGKANEFLSKTQGFPLVRSNSEMTPEHIQKTFKQLGILCAATLQNSFTHTITRHKISGSLMIFEHIPAQREEVLQKALENLLGVTQQGRWYPVQMSCPGLASSLDRKAAQKFMKHLPKEKNSHES